MRTMMGILVGLVVGLLPAAARGATTVPPGDVSGIWNAAGSPYLVGDHITVPVGLTLTIEPGVRVVFASGVRLAVVGTLLAVGTASDSVTFDVADTTGFCDPSHAGGGWGGLRFFTAETCPDTSRLRYCRLSHGKALGPNPDTNGGACYIGNGAKVEIAASRFVENRCVSFASSGGAVCCAGPDVVIRNCVFERNQAFRGGGAIVCGAWGMPIIVDNVVQDNATVWEHGRGGGISASGSQPLIARNVIARNRSVYGGGIAGIECNGGPDWGWIHILDNEITDNVAANDGGGIYLEMSHATVAGNVVQGNDATLSGGGLSLVEEVRGDLVGNLIIENAAEYGGGIQMAWATMSAANNTIVDNRARCLGGGLYGHRYLVCFANSIFWGNVAPSAARQIYLFGVDLAQFRHCDIAGGPSGILAELVDSLEYEHNLDANPEFVGRDVAAFALAPGSPCVDAGTPDTTGLHLPALDILGQPRITGASVDIGACETRTITAVDESSSWPSSRCAPFGWPNPFGAGTRLSFQIPVAAPARVSIVDVRGRRVALLRDGALAAGPQSLAWNGRDDDGREVPDGIYVARIEAAGRVQTVKLVRMR